MHTANPMSAAKLIRWTRRAPVITPGAIPGDADVPTAPSAASLRRAQPGRIGRALLASQNTCVQLLIWSALVGAFCLTLVIATRLAPLVATVVISTGLPAVLIATNKVHFEQPRGMQLLVIESYFMFVAVLSMLAIRAGQYEINRYVGYLFFIFFAVQTAGFIVDQIKKRSVFGIATTIAGSSAIFLWGITVAGSAAVIDDAGRFQMWGENAPVLIQAIYVVWAILVLLEGRTLPKLTDLGAHLTSIAIAVLSGQFFFVRLLTASQLFLFSGVIHYSNRNFISSDFLTLDEPGQERLRVIYRRRISPALFAIIVMLAALSCRQSAVRLGLLT